MHSGYHQTTLLRIKTGLWNEDYIFPCGVRMRCAVVTLCSGKLLILRDGVKVNSNFQSVINTEENALYGIPNHEKPKHINDANDGQMLTWKPCYSFDKVFKTRDTFILSGVMTCPWIFNQRKEDSKENTKLEVKAQKKTWWEILWTKSWCLIMIVMRFMIKVILAISLEKTSAWPKHTLFFSTSEGILKDWQLETRRILYIFDYSLPCWVPKVLWGSVFPSCCKSSTVSTSVEHYVSTSKGYLFWRLYAEWNLKKLSRPHITRILNSNSWRSWVSLIPSCMILQIISRKCFLWDAEKRF